MRLIFSVRAFDLARAYGLHSNSDATTHCRISRIVPEASSQAEHNCLPPPLLILCHNMPPLGMFSLAARPIYLLETCREFGHSRACRFRQSFELKAIVETWLYGLELADQGSFCCAQDGNGRIILWITFGLMAGSAIGFTILGAMRPMNQRSHACERLSCIFLI